MKIRPIFKTIDIFSFIQFLSRQTNYIIKFFLLKVLYLVYYLLNKEYQHLSRRCQNREPIDQAKLLLMETRGMREDEAYQYIRELSRRKGMSMARVASYLLAQQEERHD